ncbi:MAG: transcriptional repressor [Firmicutes bacterium]|jgi:Fur family ferric uptake transcriptional regulator|nr:transcriptional repressor [Bacillota bacterium]
MREHMQLAQVYQRLETARLRVTPQRQTVLRILSRRLGEELSAEDLHRLAAEDEDPVGLATVYRTLDILVRVGVLIQVMHEDGVSRYRLDVETLQPQQHLICVRCGDLVAFTLSWLNGLGERVHAATGFTVLDHELKLYGVCTACQGGGRGGVG